MAQRIHELTPDFWNIRGTYRLLHLVDIGTQASLARLSSGGFVLLDTCELDAETLERVRAHTDGGRALEAIVNLHPFHTLSVEKTSQLFPDARLYGTARHHRVLPELRWEPEHTESEDFAARYAGDLDLLVPQGVVMEHRNQNLHFSSVLAIHKQSGALHVDDTLNWVPLPWGGRLDFHPTLKPMLERRAGAADDFRVWAEELARRCESVQHVCTAHTRMAQVSDDPPGAIGGRVRDALARVERTLSAHEARAA